MDTPDEPVFAKACDFLGIAVFASPFNPTAVDFLESLGAPVYRPINFESRVLANSCSTRCANSLAPKHADVVLSGVAARNLVFGEPLAPDMISGGLVCPP